MRQRLLKLTPVLAAGLAVAQMVLAPAARAADPGVTSSQIVSIGMWSSLTGTTALVGTSEQDGIPDQASTEVNAQGRINGRRIRPGL